MEKTNGRTLPVPLSPSQQNVYNRLHNLLPKSPLLGLACKSGCGRTTILQNLAETLDAYYLRPADVFEQMEQLHPQQLQEGILRTFLKAFEGNSRVILDDFHVVSSILSSCYMSARPNVLGIALDEVLRLLEKGGKQLILGLDRAVVPNPLYNHCLFAGMPAFTPDDFEFLFHRLGGEKMKAVDYGRIHTFAPKLTAHQMRMACIYLEEVKAPIDTESFTRFLEAHALISNVNREEVEEVSLESLHGVGEVIRQMEVDIIVPFERDDLAKELGLRPKRGVLLYGPPGTGKTTIGRALAHRLRSKFFLIDGTVISGTQNFYGSIQNIFAQALANAPSILFIDDCDLLFENEEETGLYRYLLTMLDGLESKGNSLVTVILTAMNIGSLPPALVRSGRVELWLEMKLPDANARREILRTYLAENPLSLAENELEDMAGRTEGMTGADLRRIVADARNLYGYDVAKEQEQLSPVAYLEKAIRQLEKHREQLAAAPAFTAAHHPGASTKGLVKPVAGG